MSNDDSHDNIRIILNDQNDYGSIDIYPPKRDEPCEIDWRWHAVDQYIELAYQDITYKAHSFAEIHDILKILIGKIHANTINILFVIPQPDIPIILIEDGIFLHSSSRTPRIMTSKYFRTARHTGECIGATPIQPLPTDATMTFADILRTHVPILRAHYAPMAALPNTTFLYHGLKCRHHIGPTPNIASWIIQHLFKHKRAEIYITLTLYRRTIEVDFLDLPTNPTPTQIHDTLAELTHNITIPDHISQHQHLQYLQHIQASMQSWSTTMLPIIQSFNAITAIYYPLPSK